MRVRSLAQELPHALGMAKKPPKSENKNPYRDSSNVFSNDVFPVLGGIVGGHVCRGVGSAGGKGGVQAEGKFRFSSG